jgi:hypothetical protein
MVSVQQGWSNFLLNGAQHPDETRNVAFDGQGLQSRKNENKRKVEQACTEFAHAPAHADRPAGAIRCAIAPYEVM